MLWRTGSLAHVKGYVKGMALFDAEDSAMARVLPLLVVVVILLVVAGAWLSYSGYSEGSRLVYTTYTHLSTLMSAETFTSTWAETFVRTSVGRAVILVDTFELNDHSSSCQSPYVSDIMTPVWYGSVDVLLEAGEVHVSYDSDVNLDFWMLTPEQWSTWQEKSRLGQFTGGCDALRRLPAIAYNSGVPLDDFTIELA
jgi:hypothetical protein